MQAALQQPDMIKFWDDIWSSYTWWPAVSQSFADLTADQAAWKPSPGRTSAWQILNHIAFWNEVTLGRLDGKEPTDEQIARGNFADPAERSPAAWKAAQQRLADAHEGIRAAFEGGRIDPGKLNCLIGHTAYHIGQVMYVRALQGLPAIGY